MRLWFSDWEFLWLPAAVLAPCVLIGLGQLVFGCALTWIGVMLWP